MFLPHDLIYLTSLSRLVNLKEIPFWAIKNLKKNPYVVVRRGIQKNDQIPIGIRDYKRSYRYGGKLDLKGSKKSFKIITPYQLVQEKAWNSLSKKRRSLPALLAIPKIASILKNYQWGIGGSCEFEITSGQIMVKPKSDLDILIKDNFFTHEQAQKLLKEINQFGVHVDVQIVSNENGFSLEEYVQQRDLNILVKTAYGPILSKNPFWSIKNIF